MATNVSRESDIKLVVDFYECSGLPTDVSITPFEFKFYTTSITASFICSYDGTTFTHCKVDPLDDTKLICLLDAPNFSNGNLSVKTTFTYEDVDFPDNNYKIVRTYATGITITD